MPSHPERVRTASLPEGYQFGDARPSLLMCGMMGLGMAHVFEPAALVCNCGEKGRWLSPWYDIGGIPYNPFGQYGTNYAERFTTDRDLGDER